MKRQLSRSSRLTLSAIRFSVAAFLVGVATCAAGCNKPVEQEANQAPKALTRDAAAAPDAHTSCAQPDVAAQPNPAPAAIHKTYGAPIDTKTPEVTLSEVLASPSRYADKNIRLAGTITAVCQGRGCWLQLGDPKGSAHVKLRGHSFFVPKGSSGRSAVVEAKVLPALDEGHCEEEAKEQTGVVAKVELEASGVEIFLSLARARQPSCPHAAPS